MNDISVSTTTKQNDSDDQTSIEDSRAELRAAVTESHEILIKVTTFGLFPDTVTLDRTQLTVTKRMFLRVAEVISMRVEDILNVIVTVGPIFGTVKIFSRTASISPCVINYVWRADAIRFKRIAQGYIIAIQREIDCSQLSTADLIRQLEQLDQTDSRA